MKIVVYTALFGKRDKLWSVFPLALGGCEHVCFSDRPRQQKGLWSVDRKLLMGSESLPALPSWDVRVVPILKKSARRTARYYKTLSHKHFPEADVTIWVDANVRLLVTPQVAVKKWLGDAVLATFKHPDRKCLYQEATFCLGKSGKGNRAALRRQANAYLKEGMGRRWGLAETKCIIRRHTSEVNALNEAWWKEISTYSLRDQISLPYVCWKLGLRWRIIPGRASWHPVRGQSSTDFWFIHHI